MVVPKGLGLVMHNPAVGALVPPTVLAGSQRGVSGADVHVPVLDVHLLELVLGRLARHTDHVAALGCPGGRLESKTMPLSRGPRWRLPEWRVPRFETQERSSWLCDVTYTGEVRVRPS
jgi:hypothetical protein